MPTRSVREGDRDREPATTTHRGKNRVENMGWGTRIREAREKEIGVVLRSQEAQAARTASESQPNERTARVGPRLAHDLLE